MEETPIYCLQDAFCPYTQTVTLTQLLYSLSIYQSIRYGGMETVVKYIQRKEAFRANVENVSNVHTSPSM